MTNEKPVRVGTDDLSLLGNQGVQYPQTYDPACLRRSITSTPATTTS